MHIVLGLYGREDSLLALRETVRRTATTGDALTVAILEHPLSEQSADRLEREVRETLAPHDIRANVTRLAGDPGPALTDFAEASGFDRIVLGGGNRSPMGKIALGDVVEFVLLNAHTSITLIR